MTRRLGFVAALAVIGNAALAMPPDGPRERVSLAERLELTAEQNEQWRQLRTEREKADVRRQADARTLEIELRQLLEASTLDEQAVRAKARELGALKAAATQAQVEHRLALHKLLTPEQLERLREARPERALRGRRGARRGPRGRMPRGPAAGAGEPPAEW